MLNLKLIHFEVSFEIRDWMISNRSWCVGSENIMWQGDKAKSWGERTQEDQLVASLVLKAEWSATLQGGECCLPATSALAQTTSAGKQSSQHGGRFSWAGQTALGLRVLALSQDLNWSPAPPSGDSQFPSSTPGNPTHSREGSGGPCRDYKPKF